MRTLLEFITVVKGIEYLMVVAFCLAFIAFWILMNSKEKVAMSRVVSVAVSLSLVSAGAAVVVATQYGSDIVFAPNISEATAPESNSDDAASAHPVNDSEKWHVNISEYLSIKYGPDLTFHQVMSSKVKCRTCHHNSGDEIHACKDCHGAPFDPHNSSKPGLKAAYHQRCRSCHPEDFSDGPESCKNCHTGKITKIIQAPPRPHQLTWETCSRCHKNGIPNGGTEAKIVYHNSCLKCHSKGIAGAPKIPADHAGRAANTCSGCHRPSGG